MKNMLRIRSIAVILLMAGCMAASAFAHVTPNVVMAKRGDVIKNSLSGAANYFVRTVVLGQDDYAKIKAQGNFSPQVSKLKFFYGEDSGGNLVGTVLFDQVNTIHGPIEVGIALTPAGAVSNVAVTKATVETEPWIKAAVNDGLIKHFIGIGPHSMTDPLKGVSADQMGAMPYFMAQVITTAVMRAVVYYNILFQPRLP